MRFQGSLVQWNDERGFGWIEADGGGERIFVHISAFTPRPPAEQRPKNGLRLEFSVGVEDGKKRAQQVAWGPVARPQARSQEQRRAPAAAARGRSQPQISVFGRLACQQWLQLWRIAGLAGTDAGLCRGLDCAALVMAGLCGAQHRDLLDVLAGQMGGSER